MGLPLYVYRCTTCQETVEEFRSVASRDGGTHICAPVSCPGNIYGANRRSGELMRVFVPIEHASIPGIYNRVNRHWNESSNLPIDVQHADILTNER